ncbi:MAG TPA: hypothetical protein VLT33_47050 [Labilithrix sp.]|nr:hypothetical protein [Labilithrix sp.]
MRPGTRLLVAAALALTGCSALIGVNDIFLDPSAGGGGPDGSLEGSTSDAPTTEGGGEGGTCNGDLQVDKKNCGRCGHDCLGGDCKGGLCQVIALAGSVAGPGALALDDKNIYVATIGADTVLRVAKTGGATEVLVTGWQNMLGVAVSGSTLFWSADGALGDAGDGNFGGVWKCTLPACTDKKLVSTVGRTRHLDVKNGYLYYASESDVRRVKVDGTGDQSLVTGVNQPFAVAADATHVYYNSNQNSLQRVLIAGGGDEPVGPLVASYVGFVAVDSQRFFWAYTDGAGKGTVLGALKSAPATRTTYGEANFRSLGVASDDTNLYWSNDGTVTGTTSNGDGELLTCPVAGCVGDPVRLADKLNFAGAIALDATAVYFLEFGGRGGANGRVLKIAKP